MPDNNYLGELLVNIGADWSDLQDAIDEATKAAQSGAESIAAAFAVIDTSGEAEQVQQLADSVQEASAQMELFGDAASTASSEATDAASSMEELGTAAGGAGDDAGGAVPPLNEFGDAAESAGAKSTEAGTGISAFRASLLELAEGLAVTEGIKSLGEEALTAYASIQTATVSLTALTGSAGAAGNMIEELEQKALTIPVALDSLVAAAQKMTAFGLTAEQTNQLLGDAANAAAATGNAFDSVVQRLNMMVVAGTAGGRALASLGISTAQLATAIDQVNPGLDVTAANATKAFKALDESDRIDVLNAALEKFGGIAQAQSQTIAGQWQILKNTWDETLEVVGADLAPLAQSFINFATSAAGAVKQAADAFNSLPAPLQDLIAIATVALGSSGVLLTGLAAFALTAQGLASIPEILDQLAINLGKLGIAAPGVEAAATGLASVGAAEGGVAGTTASVEALGAGLGAAGIAGIALGAILTGAVWYEAIQLTEKLTADMTAMQHAMSTGQGATAAQAAEIANLTQQINAYNASASKTAQIPLPDFNPQTESVTQYVAALTKAASGIQGVGVQSASAQAQLAALRSGGVISLTAGLAQLTAATGTGIAMSKSAQTAADTLTTAYINQQAKVAALKEVVAAYTQSMQTQTPIVGEGVITAGQLADANTKLSQAEKQLGAMVDGTTTSLKAHKQVMDDIANATVPTFAQSVQNAWDKITEKVNAGTAALQTDIGVWLEMQTSGTASAQAVADAVKNIDTAQKAAGLSADDMGSMVESVMSRLGISFEGLATNWNTAVADFGIGSDQAKAAAKALFDVWTEAGGSASGLMAYMNSLGLSLQSVTGVLKDGHVQWVEANSDVLAFYRSAMSLVPGFQEVTGAGADSVQVFNNITVAAKGALSAANNFGAGVGQLNTALHATTDGATLAKQVIALLGTQVQQNTFDWATWSQQIDTLTNSTNAMDPVIQQAIQLLNAEAQAADSAADGVTNLTNATNKMKGMGGAGGANQPGGMSQDQWLAYMSSGGPAAEFTQGLQFGTGFVGGTSLEGLSGINAFSDAVKQTAPALNTTTASVNNLTDSLTGHSLAPALDITAASTDNLSQSQDALNSITGNVTDAVSALSTRLSTDLTKSVTDASTAIQDLSSLPSNSYVSPISSQPTSGPPSSAGATTEVSPTQYTSAGGTWYYVGGQWQLQAGNASTPAQGAPPSSDIYTSPTSSQPTSGPPSTAGPTTQVSPTQYTSAGGTWYYVGGQWQLEAGNASTPGVGGVPTDFGAYTGAPSATPTSGPPGVTGGTQVSSTQVDTAQGDWYYVGGRWTLQSGSGTLPTPNAGGGSVGGGLFGGGGGYIAPSAYQGGGGPPAMAVTMNISGMTPSNAQQVSQQVVTNLRMLGLKVT